MARTARFEALHAAAGVRAVRNLYLPKCGPMIDDALRSHYWVAQKRVADWLNQRYGKANWNTKCQMLDTGDTLINRRGRREGEFVDLQIKETWKACPLPREGGRNIQ